MSSLVVASRRLTRDRCASSTLETLDDPDLIDVQQVKQLGAVRGEEHLAARRGFAKVIKEHPDHTGVDGELGLLHADQRKRRLLKKGGQDASHSQRAVRLLGGAQ